MPDAGSDQFEFNTVAVIGLGYVGLPLARQMCEAGLRTIGVDIDPDKVEMLNRGECYLRHLGASFAADMRASGRFEATTDESMLAQADAVLICVPTPLDEDQEPDLSHVKRTGEAVAKALRARGRSQLIVLESTTWPGTTREVLKPILDEAGVRYALAFSPERIDPGRTDVDPRQIPKVVGGVNERSTRAAEALYSKAFDQVVTVDSSEIAEAAKLLENVYRAVNIALINEMKVVLDRLGIDVWKVIDAAATKPFGFQPFYPGPGLGGHCIPIDPFYLAWKASQTGVDARFIELAGVVNRSMPRRVVENTIAAIAARVDESDRTGRVLVLGLAYKPDIDDVRESPSFELIRLFREAKLEVDYSDPHVPETPTMRHWGDLDLRSVELTEERLGSYDAVVVATAHRNFDWELIARAAPLIIDTRNALRDYPSARVVKA
ncbi:MAG: nucleotide sugar dehydrogenase [Phycisphaerales bacterium]